MLMKSSRLQMNWHILCSMNVNVRERTPISTVRTRYFTSRFFSRFSAFYLASSLVRLVFSLSLAREQISAHALAHSSFDCEWADICTIYLWQTHRFRCILLGSVHLHATKYTFQNRILDKNYNPTQVFV